MSTKHIAEQFELPAVAVPPATRTHHKYGMSKLDYLDGCSGFKSNGGTNRAAEDGTRLHEIMDKVVALVKHNVIPFYALDALQRVLVKETVSDEEMYWLEFCCKELDYWLAKRPIQILHEQKISILRPDGTELNHGHYDLLIFLSKRAAVVIDWKFGWLPVRPAATNLQGRGYSTGCMQKYPDLEIVGAIFVQPKLQRVTRCSYKRAELPEMYRKINDVIARADNPEKQLRIGTYCDYCAHATTCTALITNCARAVEIHEGLPMPKTFNGLQINNPEDCVKALYVVERLEVLIEQSGLKDKAKEFAKLNGGSISCEIEPGKTVTVELKERAAPRSANSPALIAEALKEVLLPEQVLGACDPKITRLEEIFADAFIAKRKAEAEKIIAEAEAEAKWHETHGRQSEAEGARDAALTEAKATRTTRKQACEILASTLQAEGLLSVSEHRVEYLKVRVEPTQPTQIPNKN